MLFFFEFALCDQPPNKKKGRAKKVPRRFLKFLI